MSDNMALRKGGGIFSLVLIVAALVFAGCASGAQAIGQRASTPPVAYVVKADSIAGLRIAPDTPYRVARQYFTNLGQRGSTTLRGSFCYLNFPNIDLSMTFAAVDRAASAARCTFLPGAAVVSAPRWHTANGLHVGAAVASLHRLFPKAHLAGRTSGHNPGVPKQADMWWLANWSGSNHAARPVLTAYVRAGRVTALGIGIVGH